MKDKKKQAILAYIVMQTVFLWVFINFPLHPFPGKVYVNEGDVISEYNAYISLGQYLYPKELKKTENIDRIEFKPLGWILLVLIVFLTPILLAFRWSIRKVEKRTSDETELNS